jgi:hypothetical protein
MTDRSRNTIALIAIIGWCALVTGFLASLMDAKSGQIAGALGFCQAFARLAPLPSMAIHLA